MQISENFTYSRVSQKQQLSQILEIQQKNTKKGLSARDIRAEGFVTVIHELELLEKMNKICPHIIASNNQRVIGYALAMDPTFRRDISVLAPLFELTDELLASRKYLVMGQICIDKPFRGKGVFRGMYEYYRDQLSPEYECLVTEVALENQRSMMAHKTIGFETLHKRTDCGKDWQTLIWEWTS